MADAESSTSRQEFVRTRVIRIVLDGKPSSDPLTFLARPKSTFGDITTELESCLHTKVTVLEAKLGPEPLWTRSEHGNPIGDTCRTIYALVDDPRPYIYGVVRGPLSDYPVRIFELAQPTTVYKAILASQPDLVEKIESVTDLSGKDIKDQLLGVDGGLTKTNADGSVRTVYILMRKCEPLLACVILFSFPNHPIDAEITCADSAAPDELQLKSKLSIGIIPPFLKIAFEHCSYLLGRKGHHDAHLLINHLLRASLHTIISLAEALAVLYKADDLDLEAALISDESLVELLPVAPHLAGEIEEALDRIEKIIDQTDRTETDLNRILDGIYKTLCGDYPGAVAVRRSHTAFQDLRQAQSLVVERDSIRIQTPTQYIHSRSQSPLQPSIDTHVHDPSNSRYVNTEPTSTLFGDTQTLRSARNIEAPVSLGDPFSTWDFYYDQSRNPKRPLRLLAIDGTGFVPGGIYQLKQLQNLMQQIQLNRQDFSVLPCEYFDMIGGTSTGGLIAILLGRFRLDVTGCLEIYVSILRNVYGRKRSRWRLSQAMFDQKVLETFILERLEELTGGNATTQFTTLLDTPGAVSATMYDSSDNRCKVVVAAHAKLGHIRKPTLFRTYCANSRAPDVRSVWQVICAAFSGPNFFDPVTIEGSVGERVTIVDAASGCGNPAYYVYDEAEKVWPAREIGCIISLGTSMSVGTPQSDRTSDTSWWSPSWLQELQRNAYSCEETHNEMLRQRNLRGIYFRLNPEYPFHPVSPMDWATVGFEDKLHGEYTVRDEKQVTQLLDRLEALDRWVEDTQERHTRPNQTLSQTIHSEPRAIQHVDLERLMTELDDLQLATVITARDLNTARDLASTFDSLGRASEAHDLRNRALIRLQALMGENWGADRAPFLIGMQVDMLEFKTRLASIMIIGRNCLMLSCARANGPFSPAFGWLPLYKE